MTGFCRTQSHIFLVNPFQQGTNAWNTMCDMAHYPHIAYIIKGLSYLTFFMLLGMKYSEESGFKNVTILSRFCTLFSCEKMQ